MDWIQLPQDKNTVKISSKTAMNLAFHEEGAGFQ